jgi:hypothetical protein
MTYGGVVPAITPIYSGFMNGQTNTALTAQPTCPLPEVTATSAVGSYPTACQGASDSNYAITYQAGSLHVRAATLGVTASSATMTYGGTVPPVTPSYTGFVNGQSSSVISTAPTCGSPSVSPTSNAGSYPTSCSGAAAPNYAFAYVKGSISVAPASITVAASSPSMTYGGTVPVITAKYVGFVNGQSPAVLTERPECSAAHVTRQTHVGTYNTGCSGAVDANYSFTYRTGSLTVNAATLTVTAVSTFMLVGGSVPQIVPLYSGFVLGQDESNLTVEPHCSTTATPSSREGVYPTACSGAVDPNYSIRYVDGRLTVGENPGYRLEGGDGGVFDFHKTFVGSVPPPSLGLHIFDFVGMATTETGYWLVERSGGVFAFGSARFDGSLPSRGIHVDDIVGIAATPDGGGYWLLASNGTVYAFGSAAELGGASAAGLTDFVAITSPDAGGYWLLTAAGRVYAYGDAHQLGDCQTAGSSCGSTDDIVGMAMRGDDGYWLVGRDGGVFAFGDAHFFGSCPTHSSGCRSVDDVVGIASPDPGGYWLAEANGNVIPFGDAHYYGRCGMSGDTCSPLVRPIMAISS